MPRLAYILGLGLLLKEASQIDSINLFFAVSLCPAFVCLKFGVNLRPYCSYSLYLQYCLSTCAIPRPYCWNHPDLVATLLPCGIIRGR